MTDPLPRSPDLMSAGETALLIVDVQTRLIDHIPKGADLVFNCGRLIEGAGLLGLPVIATEQYPQGLGPTVPQLARLVEHRPAKRAFSCGACADALAGLTGRGIHKILVAGIETHVCVMQSVMDLLAHSFRVFVAVDAVGARHAVDHDTALRRMDASGAVLTTTESALFEWCERSSHPRFKDISRLIKSGDDRARGDS